jgi:hypothetical protein
MRIHSHGPVLAPESHDIPEWKALRCLAHGEIPGATLGSTRHDLTQQQPLLLLTRYMHT